MSILTVSNVSHGFGDRAILEDVSFRLLPGEHVGLIGANGEGKSTFMNMAVYNQMRARLSGQRMYVLVILISIPYSRMA